MRIDIEPHYDLCGGTNAMWQNLGDCFLGCILIETLTHAGHAEVMKELDFIKEKAVRLLKCCGTVEF